MLNYLNRPVTVYGPCYDVYRNGVFWFRVHVYGLCSCPSTKVRP